jgi:hypothetical protein
MMSTDFQLALFETLLPKKETVNVSEWGTFKDSLKAPVHGWFTYPAGFSYKAVEYSLKNADLTIGQDTVYDPFMGSGTTNLVAKSLGYNSIGVEAHPFVYPVTKSKMDWDVSTASVHLALNELEFHIKNADRPYDLSAFLNTLFPELISKCFLPETLFELWVIRDALKLLTTDDSVRNLLRTGLICVLRDVSIAATGWPYIAPGKVKITSMSKRGWSTYRDRVLKMTTDLIEIRKKSTKLFTTHQILYGDSRHTVDQISDYSADHIFTSPPYLNNFDYADRTRLEMYFMGEATGWADITEQVRTKLMTSATTQIARQDEKYKFSKEFKTACPDEFAFLSDAVKQLSAQRLVKGGKKSYDLMVIGYFNDMYEILRDNFRILRPNRKAQYILGDSAPYGIHIPTDELIGRIGVRLGFNRFDISILRERGNKWENNPQRHGVALRESVVTLYK